MPDNRVRPLARPVDMCHLEIAMAPGPGEGPERPGEGAPADA